MSDYDPSLGPDLLDLEHDILLVAGSRAEVARLAPVATAFADAGRIRALTVATGPDPMAVHDAFEALGVPIDITLLLREPPSPHPAAVASVLMTRLDDLLVELDPSAVMVQGGGVAAAVTAQVAFWRQIPVVHLQSGVASDDLVCPFPQEANRRVIGQLASLFLTTGGAALGSPIGPNAIPVGDTMASNRRGDARFASLVKRVRGLGSHLVLVRLDAAESVGVLAGLAELLEREPDVEIVLFGELAGRREARPLGRHGRTVVVRDVPLAELVGLAPVSTVLVSDDPELVDDAPGLGVPAVLVDGPYTAEPGDPIQSILGPAVTSTLRQVLAAARTETSPGPASPSDGREAARAEQAVAWMFGMCPSPLLDQHPSSTDA